LVLTSLKRIILAYGNSIFDLFMGAKEMAAYYQTVFNDFQLISENPL